MRAARQAEEIKELRQAPEISKRSEELAQTHRVTRFSKLGEEEDVGSGEMLDRFKQQERVKQSRLNEEREQNKIKEMEEFTGRPKVDYWGYIFRSILNHGKL